MKKILILLVVGVFMVTPFVGATTQHEEMLPPYTGSQEFETLKGLIGKWEGTHQMGEEAGPATVEYKLTSNGSAVIETLFPGTPQKMVTVYHDKGGKLVMTHYCSLANQPKMDLVASSEGKLEFDLTAHSDINVTEEPHMHALTLNVLDEDHLVHHWTFYEKGEVAGTTTITLSRVK